MNRMALTYTLAACGAALLIACGGSATQTSAPTPVSSPSSQTATATPQDAQADLQAKEGVHAIEVGLQAWAVAQASPHYPRTATAAVLAKYMVDPWPINPFTGSGMRPGTGHGDYQYRVAANRKRCTITVRLSDGSEYTPQVLQL